MNESLAFLISCAAAAFILLLLSGFKARGWWVCICGARFRSNNLLDKHINECEAMK